MKKFLEQGSPLVTILEINRKSNHIKVYKPEEGLTSNIPIGSFARIHSIENHTLYNVWILDDNTFNTIQVQVKIEMMSALFKQHPHQIFSHFS